MASLRAPGLGPIVGYTSDTECRVWIRAGDPGDNNALLDEDRRTVGIIGIVVGTKAKPKIGDAWYFRLKREYDRTGTFLLGKDRQLGWYPDDFRQEDNKKEPSTLPKGVVSAPLEPDTEYTVRVGTLTVDDPNPNDATVPDWKLRDRLPKIDAIKQELLVLDERASEATFRTFPRSDQVAPSLTFLLGSCRYPGLLWKIKDADRIFGPMQAHFEPDNKLGGAARFTMMCGDQIYADVLNRHIPLMRADTYEEFQERYLTAFSAPNLRKLMRHATTYMILDDHEIEDNWTQDRLQRGDPGAHQIFNHAINAYMSYQWSHGPRTWGQLLYYTFACGSYPFFVIDTRTQRLKNNIDRETDKGLRDNHLLGYPSIDEDHPGQLSRLLAWLSTQQKEHGDIPKFVVSPSVFVPNAIDERIEDVNVHDPDRLLFEVNKSRRDLSDTWPAFPLTRRALLDTIVERNIQNVVFLSGDIHCANVAEISFSGTHAAAKLKAFSVTSSAFYWPFPFADGDPNGYVHDSQDSNQWDPFPVLGNSVQMHYKAYNFTQDDNFSRLDVDKGAHTITVRVFDKEGQPVRIGEGNDKRELISVLQLAPW